MQYDISIYPKYQLKKLHITTLDLYVYVDLIIFTTEKNNSFANLFY